MTKAASYLLWWKEFSLIRNYLLKNMVWMISDSTGIPTDHAAPPASNRSPTAGSTGRSWVEASGPPRCSGSSGPTRRSRWRSGSDIRTPATTTIC